MRENGNLNKNERIAIKKLSLMRMNDMIDKDITILHC